MNPTSRTLAAALVASCCLAWLPAAANADDAAKYREACELHVQGRHAAAFGRFVELADRGHIESARHALAMLLSGPTLYNTAWTATPGQLQRWTRLASSAAVAPGTFVGE